MQHKLFKGTQAQQGALNFFLNHLQDRIWGPHAYMRLVFDNIKIYQGV